MAASCEKDLKKRIDERYKNIPEEEKRGATYFKLAILSMTSMGYAVTRALEMKISFLKIVDFDDGDVNKAIKFYKGGHQRLWLVQPKSPNTIKNIFQFLQTSPCFKFNNYFSTMEANLETKCMLEGGNTRISDHVTEAQLWEFKALVTA